MKHVINWVLLGFVVMTLYTMPIMAMGVDGTAVCALGHCASKRQLTIGGLALGAAVLGTATVAYTVGPRAAMAAAGGFLLFGHFLFDAVPLAIGGVAAWWYGPQVWEWLGFVDTPGQEPPNGT